MVSVCNPSFVGIMSVEMVSGHPVTQSPVAQSSFAANLLFW